MFNNHLMYRLIVLNGCAIAALAWAWGQGYLSYIEKDGSRISLAIIALFCVGMASLIIRAVKVTRVLNGNKHGTSYDINAVKFLAKGDHIDTISGLLVSLGFFGTVVGLMSMLFGGGGLTSDGSLDSIKAIIDRIISGGGIAFITTAVGLMTSMWLDWNASMLRTATICMLQDNEVVS